MRPRLTDARGFTLVEGLVVGLIAAVVAVIFVPFMKMHNISISDGTARAKILIQADALSADIGRRVRMAAQVRPSDENWGLRPNLAVRDNLTHVVVFDASGAVSRAWKIEGGYLKESSDNGTFTLFKTGGDTVRIAAGSFFKVSFDRQELTVNLILSMPFRGATYTSMNLGNMYQCRNNREP